MTNINFAADNKNSLKNLPKIIISRKRPRRTSKKASFTRQG